MNRLSRVNEAVVVQLNTLEDDVISSLTYLSKPAETLLSLDYKFDQVENVDLEIDEAVINKYLVENIEDDLACSIKIYQTFKRIDTLTLLDNRVWTYYSIEAFWEYTFKRYLKDKCDASSFKNHALLKSTKQENIFKNSIAKLWWIANVTRNPNEEYKYKVTEYVFKNPIFIDTILLLPQSKNKNFVKKFFESYFLIVDDEWNVKKEDEKFVTDLYDYLKHISLYNFIDMYDVADLLKLIEEFYEIEYSQK